ncbi:MAG: D-alanyl-D-alanine carboxypeptidase [Candidatus Eisenbacteria bacterium]|uniref:serine-type D-Ala-D-Ala carboxypeptidase n=1 Tax=Eiseniibacteriota bacterium TaxID=2212470 RepID=A0A956SEL9_UNCEI|nr:D-alanyl-D-alanine carboxypeptidase [Candidatus Eisenbacteria bacterium]MCB9465497.1 D-alanyl-D-alanine carboxypeptidase [Candidatus Eisenbacteria bacterium]
MRPHLSRLPMKLRSSLHRTLRRPTRPGVAFALSAPVLTSRPGSRTGFVVLAIAIVGFGLVGLTGCGGGDTEAVPPMPELPDAPVLRFSGRPLEWAGEACESAILIEAETGTILYEKNSHDRRPPASIAKMMLELVVMREVDAGRLSLNDSIRVSGSASKLGGSQVYLKQGEVFSLEQMLEAIAIGSANDACVAVAEHIAGTPGGFVQLMNREADLLRLEATEYKNVHGLDDDPNAINLTTAFDIAQIARQLVQYPDVLRMASTAEAPFRDGQFILRNTNELVGRFPGLDGLKTGYTSKAGFCLCATAKRGDLRLISVVLGCPTNRDRFGVSRELLGLGFGSFLPMEIAKRGDVIETEVPVAGGTVASIHPVVAHDLTVIVSRPDDRLLETRFVPVEDLQAPLDPWDPVGEIEVVVDDHVLATVPVWTPVAVPKSGLGGWLKSRFS